MEKPCHQRGYKWESENSLPDITLLPRLASYFNISIDELIGYEPQMTKEEIRRQYLYFKGILGTKPFLDVQMELDEKIKKYYSCFPFLLQMAVLLLNHFDAAEIPEDGLMWALTLARFVLIVLPFALVAGISLANYEIGTGVITEEILSQVSKTTIISSITIQTVLYAA